MSKKILLVEDEIANRLLFVDVLEHNGYTMVEAENGAIAVDLAQSEKPDLILMDMQLPVKDGMTATREIKAIPEISQIPVVALTASVMKDERQKMIDSGCSEVVSKPILARALVEVVQKYIG
jgi:two-component system, cell cycle response regulator DivK